jgi:3-hydroxyisobutyrate dehydrogenase
LAIRRPGIETNVSGVKRISVLGTGIMGAPIARNLAAAGFETRAWNRTREKAESLASDGVEVADTPAEAAGGSDAVITMLAAADAVRDVMAGDAGALGAMEEGSIWLQMSTIGIAATEEMAKLGHDAGVVFVDSPVLGTKQPAEQGNLVVLAAGPAEAREACAPLFDAIGAKTIEFDEPGEATRLKLVLNNWVLSVTVATAETIALAERLGIQPRMFLEAIEGGNLDSAYAQMKGRMMIERSFDPSFPLGLALKDARLLLDAASDDREAPALPAAVERRLAQAEGQGHGDEDMAAVYWAAGGEPVGDR